MTATTKTMTDQLNTGETTLQQPIAVAQVHSEQTQWMQDDTVIADDEEHAEVTIDARTGETMVSNSKDPNQQGDIINRQLQSTTTGNTVHSRNLPNQSNVRNYLKLK